MEVAEVTAPVKVPIELLKGPFQVVREYSKNVLTLQAMVGHQCGKSRLLCRFLFGNFEEIDDPTVGNYSNGTF
jgi:hypothetical protein